jgi:hypothetical protein
MGLDMYLYKKTYVKNWEHNPPETKHTFEIKRGGVLRNDIKPERICYITEEVAYWRKFNALHGWFVNECGDGEDDCKEVYVDESKIEELLVLLKQVQEKLNNSKIITTTAKDWRGEDVEVKVYECADEVVDLFPPTQGFFFGGSDIDEWYKQDVDNTIEVLEELVKENEQGKELGLYGGDYYYRASW